MDKEVLEKILELGKDLANKDNEIKFLKSEIEKFKLALEISNKAKNDLAEERNMYLNKLRNMQLEDLQQKRVDRQRKSKA